MTLETILTLAKMVIVCRVRMQLGRLGHLTLQIPDFLSWCLKIYAVNCECLWSGAIFISVYGGWLLNLLILYKMDNHHNLRVPQLCFDQLEQSLCLRFFRLPMTMISRVTNQSYKQGICCHSAMAWSKRKFPTGKTGVLNLQKIGSFYISCCVLLVSVDS